MVNPKDYLKIGQEFHGHKCPAMPLGLRVGAAAMNKLGVERAKDSQLVAILELGDNHCATCFADGIQVITGCTFGKGNITKLHFGKWGLTLVEAATGRAVRVAPIGSVQVQTKDTEFFHKYRMPGIPASEVPDEVVEPLITQVMNAPDNKLLTISEVFHYDLPKHPHTFAGFICDECGDMVVEGYGRPMGDKKVCQACYNRALEEGRV